MLRRVAGFYRQRIQQHASSHHSSPRPTTSFSPPRLPNQSQACLEQSALPQDRHVQPVLLNAEDASSQSSKPASPFPVTTYDAKRYTPQKGNLIPSASLIQTLDAFARHTTAASMLADSEKIRSFPLHYRYFRNRDVALETAQHLTHEYPRCALQALKIAYHLGYYLKTSHLENIAFHLAQAAHWAYIPLLASMAKEYGCSPSVRLLNWKLRTFIELRRYADLESVHDEMVTAQLRPTRRTYHLLISAHLRNRNLEVARLNLQRMVASGISIDPSTHAVIISAYRSLGLDEEVHAQALEGLCMMDDHTATTVLNSMVQHFLDAHDQRGAARILECFRYQPPSASPVASTSHTLPLCALNSIETPSFLPNAGTYVAIMNYQSRNGNLPGVLRTLSRMRNANIPPNSSAAAAVIRALCLNQRYDVAVSMLSRMGPSESQCQRLFRIARLTPTSDLPMDPTGILLTLEVLNSLLHGLLKFRGLIAARALLRLIHETGHKPDEQTAEVIMDYLESATSVRPRELIRILRTFAAIPLQPNLRHVHIILRSVLRREKFLKYGSGWDVTAAKFSRTRRERRLDDVGILDATDNLDPSAGMSFPRRLQYASLVRPVLRSLIGRGIRSDRATFAMRIRHDALTRADMAAADASFKKMVARGMHPNAYHYAALMDGYARQGRLRKANALLETAAQNGVQLNVVLYTILISGYARQGKPALASQVFDAMVCAAIKPDVAAIDAVAHAYFAVGAYRMARRVLIELWPQIAPLPVEMHDASLKQLAKAFRALPANSSSSEKLSKQEQRAFHSKLRRLLRDWEHYMGNECGKADRATLERQNAGT